VRKLVGGDEHEIGVYQSRVAPIAGYHPSLGGWLDSEDVESSAFPMWVLSGAGKNH
jgi:hypothetical protein